MNVSSRRLCVETVDQTVEGAMQSIDVLVPEDRVDLALRAQPGVAGDRELSTTRTRKGRDARARVAFGRVERDVAGLEQRLEVAGQRRAIHVERGGEPADRHCVGRAQRG